MKKEIRDELIELDSTLSEMDRPLQDSIPVMYFEGFADRLILKMDIEPAQVVRTKPNAWWLPLFAPKLAFAMASIAILITVSVIYFRTPNSNLPIAAIAISQEDAFAEVTQHIDQYDVEAIVDGTLTEVEMESIMQDLVPINNDELIDEAFESIEIEDIL